MKHWILTTGFFFILCGLQAQNVGIGTTNPSRAKLEVHGVAGSGTTSAVFGSELAGVSFQRGWPTIGFNQYRESVTGNGKFMAYGFGALQNFDPATSVMAFDMMGGGQSDISPSVIRRALSFDYSGRAAIGNAGLNASLSVARGGHNATAYFFGSQHYSALNLGSAEDTYIRAGKDGGTVFINDITGSRVALGGFVGINTATPAYPLEIRESGGRGIALVEPANFIAWDLRIIPDNGAANLYLNIGNDITRGWFRSSDGSYNHVSDARLKTGIETLPSLLKRYLQLRPVTYRMVHDNPQNQQNIGFIAQQVKELFPELVTVSMDSTGGYPGINDLHMLDYEGFSVLTIKAIQEQQAILTAQHEAIEQLRNRVDAMKKKLAAATKPASQIGSSTPTAK